MKRLTTHDPNRQILVCSANYKSWNEIYDRLAAYEDTGLEPEEINDICHRFSCFLSEMTRNSMSKLNYTLEAMIQCAQDAHELDCEDYCFLKQAEKEETENGM